MGIDVVVQSTDKNFLVPVGGSLLWAPKQTPGLVERVAQAYPGRASAAAHLDLMCTLLHWGADGWLAVLRQREEVYLYLQARSPSFFFLTCVLFCQKLCKAPFNRQTR